jgi:hypothetical protein
MRRSVDGGSPPVNYFAFSRTSGSVSLHAFPFASAPLKLDCAVCAAADTLHQRVRVAGTLDAKTKTIEVSSIAVGK